MSSFAGLLILVLFLVNCFDFSWDKFIINVYKHNYSFFFVIGMTFICFPNFLGLEHPVWCWLKLARIDVYILSRSYGYFQDFLIKMLNVDILLMPFSNDRNFLLVLVFIRMNVNCYHFFCSSEHIYSLFYRQGSLHWLLDVTLVLHSYNISKIFLAYSLSSIAKSDLLVFCEGCSIYIYNFPGDFFYARVI